MKLNQIFLILSITLILQLSARHVQNQTLQGKTKAKQNTKGLWDRLFSNWNNAKFTVHGLQQLEFSCQIQDAFRDDSQNEPLGIAFDGFQQISHTDQSGFMNYVVALHQVDGKVLQMPILDYRFVQNCLFTDNANDWFWKDWVLSFNTNSNEDYQHNKNKPSGNSWKVDMRLPSLSSDQTKGLKDKLRALCQARNKQINALKDTAIKSGDSYKAGVQLSESKLASIQTQEKLGTEKTVLLTTVKTEQTIIQTQFKLQIEQNEKTLKESMDELQQSASLSQSTEDQIELLYKKIGGIKDTLSVLETKQTIIKTNIDQSQQDLSDAHTLQNGVEGKSESIAKDQNELQVKTKQDKNEYDSFFQEQQAKMQKMKEDYEAKQQLNKNKQELLMSQQASAKAQQENINKNIEELQLQISGQKQQVKSIDDQSQLTQQYLEEIEGKLNQKITISNKFEIEQKRQQDIIKQQEIKITIIRTEQIRKITLLKTQQIAQITQLNLKVEETKQLIEDAETAALNLDKNRALFEVNVNNIIKAASATRINCQKALNYFDNGQWRPYIDTIVSNSYDQMKMAQMRFLKQQKQQEQISKYRFQQMHKVRLMRNKLKSKIHKRLLRQ